MTPTCRKPVDRHVPGRRCIAWLAILLLGGGGLLGRRCEAVEGPLRYRREFVPEAQLAEHVRGLLPLKRDEFERRVKQLALGPDSGSQATLARIEEAEYRGRIEDDRIVSGTGELAIHCSAAGLASLPIAPFNLPLTGAVWRGSTEQPALLGLASDNRLTCLVERSGNLQIAWSLRGRREDQGTIAFALQLPAAPLCRLRLEAPADRTLTAEPGIARLEPATTGAKNARTWIVELGGLTETVLRVRPRQAAAASLPVVLVRENTQYVVQPTTIDLESSLTLDITEQSLPQLTLALDEAIQPTALRLGPHQLTWTLLPESEGVRKLLVELPEPLTGGGHALQFSGVASWTGQRGWRLPRARLVEGIWQDGRATLTAPTALRVGAMAVGGCRQTGFSASSPVRGNDQFQFQLYLPDGGVEISPATATPALTETSGLHLQFDATQIVGVAVAELSAAAGERFELEAIIPQRWVVDSVEIQPADFLEDRSVAPRGPGLQTLRLLLRRPLAEGQPLRVVVRAHCRRPPAGSGPLPGNVLKLVEFLDVRDARRLVSLRNLDPGVHLRLTSDEGLARLDPKTLTSEQLRLFDDQPGPVVFERSSTVDAVGVLLEPTSPQFQAEATVQVFAEKTRVRQRIRLRCLPELSSIGQLQVRLSPAPNSIDWQLAGEEGRGLTFRKLASDAGATDEAIYELSLTQPRSTTFELAGEFSTPLDGELTAVLASLPAASVQRGMVEVHAANGGEWTISGEEVRALPTPDLGPDSFTTLRGRFAYEPGRRAAVRIAPRGTRDGLELAWIESLQLTSLFAADGSGEHEALFQITNAGRSEFEFALPRTAVEVRAALAGEPILAPTQRPGADAYVVALPPGKRPVAIHVRYSTHPLGRSWVPWGNWTAPIPQTTLPVLAARWQVALPPDVAPDSRWLLADETASGERVAADLSAAGWIRYEAPLVAGPTATIGVWQPAIINAWAWCLGLAAAALTYRLLVGRVALIVLLAGVAAGLAGWISPSLVPLAIGTALGVVAGGLGLALRPRLSVAEPFTLAEHASTVAVAGPAAGVVVLLGMFWLARLASAAPPVTAANGDAQTLRMVSPVDHRDQPAGDYVFLDPKLYDALVKPSGRDAPAPESWLIVAAQYRLDEQPQGDGPRRGVDELIAQFDLETFQANTLVLLPFQRAQVHLVEGRARLDGQPVRLDWSPDGKRLQFSVETPGRHRLELVLGAAAQADISGVVLDLEIPPVPVARVLIAAPDDLVQVESALGIRAAGGTEVERPWQLGPAQRLTVRWPPSARSGDRAPRVEAEQLLLWSIRPGSVVADARFRIRPVGGEISEVVLRIDPRLRLLPLDSAQPVVRYTMEEGTPTNTIRLALREPIAAETSLKLSLLWVGSAGLGNLMLPTATIAADELTRSWMGISLAPGLDWETPPPSRPGDPVVADFAAAWGESLGERAAAFDLKNSLFPKLVVRPTRTQARCVQALDASFSGSNVVVHFRADLTGVSSDQFQHRLTAPSQLRTRQVTAWDAATPIPARWIQEPDGSILVTLTQAPAATLRLELVAEQQLPAGSARATIPLVRYAAASPATYSLRLHRQSDVLVTVASAPAAWKPAVAASAGEFRAGVGRLLAAWEQSSGQNPLAPQVTLALNRPQVTGNLAVRVERGAMGWTAVAECLLDVQGGQLDLVRVQTPPSWTGPFEINPAVEQRLEPASGEIGRQLVIRPQRALAGLVRLSIRGPLKSSGGELVTVPELKLVDAPLVQRIVAFPNRLAGQRLEWETSGLQAVDPASLALPAEVLPAGYEVFQSVADRFSAAARLRDRPTSSPLVRLADHVVQVGSQGEYVGRWRLALDPGGARQLTLELPAGQQLVNVSVEGTPAQLTQIGGRRWLVGLVAERLPQSIEIVSRGHAARGREAPGQLTLAAPRLVEARVQRTFWTVHGATPVSQEKRANPRQLQVARLASIAGLLESLADLPAADVPASAVAQCWANWQRRFNEQRQALPATDSLVPSQLASLVREAEREAASVRNQLLSTGVVTADELSVASSGAPSSSPVSEPAPTTCHEFAGPAETLAVTPPTTPSTTDGRQFWAGFCLAAAMVFFKLVASRRVREWLAEHAPLLLALAGLGWVWLGPVGWLGWLAVALAVWLALRFPWPRRAAEPLSSVVRRSSLLR